ncbi:MAG: ester cyclase [Methanotrichaceae archaeon]
MLLEENKNLARHSFEEFFTRGNIALADEILSNDFVLRDPTSPDFSGGRDGYKQLQVAHLRVFPDHNVAINDIMPKPTKW